ncbi:MAG: S49 family peptidase [Halobacteriota archaeon]
MRDSVRSTFGDRARSIRALATDSLTLVVLSGVVVGLAVAPFVGGGGIGGPEETVAVVPIDGSIDGERAADISDALRTARADDSIVAVVLVANSGGGGAVASEELYMQVLRTANTMPVVASVDGIAASGAYYAIAPSEHVYAKPASQVGSVGVLATIPPTLEPNDVVATTGPSKLSGGDRRTLEHELETLRRAFVGAVVESRGDRLSIPPEELSAARTYAGHGAIEAGLVDEIGDREAAIERAGAAAGVDRYEVTEFRGSGPPQFVSQAAYVGSTAPTKEAISFERFLGTNASGPIVVMMHPDLVSTPTWSDESVTTADRRSETTSQGDGASNESAPVLEAAAPDSDRRESVRIPSGGGFDGP